MERLSSMEKVPFLLIVFLIFWQTETADAQLVKSIGLRAGFSYNLPYNKEAIKYNEEIQTNTDFDNYLFLFGGLQAESTLPYKRLSLLTNLSYISKGSTIRGGGSSGGYGSFGGGGGHSEAQYANYANIDFSPKYSIPLNDNDFYVFAGPYLALLADYNSFYEYTFFTAGSYYSQEKLMLNPLVFGGTIGLGLDIKAKSECIKYNIQFQYLQDVTWAANFNFSDSYLGYNRNYSFKARNKTLLFSFGARYLFKKHE